VGRYVPGGQSRGAPVPSGHQWPGGHTSPRASDAFTLRLVCSPSAPAPSVKFSAAAAYWRSASSDAADSADAAERGKSSTVSMLSEQVYESPPPRATCVSVLPATGAATLAPPRH